MLNRGVWPKGCVLTRLGHAENEEESVWLGLKAMTSNSNSASGFDTVLNNLLGSFDFFPDL